MAIKITSKFLLVVMLLLPIFTAFSQEESDDIDIKPKDKFTEQGWNINIDFGIDFISNLFINPKVGGGKNRLGLGVEFTLNSLYNDGRFSWANFININYGIQKVDNEYNKDLVGQKVPFQKSIDNLWWNSQITIRTSYFSKFYYSSDLFFSSQLSKSYEDNYLEDVTGKGVISKFMSPANLQFSLGIDYRPNNYWSILMSPFSYKSIIVLDDDIADDYAVDRQGNFLGSIHGNPLKIEGGKFIYNNFDHQLGSVIRIKYRNKVTKRFDINTNLMLYSDYQTMDHIDVNWRNELNLKIFKGLKLSLLSILAYDHDIFVQISDNNAINGVNGVNGLGRRVSYTQQFLLRYSFTVE